MDFEFFGKFEMEFCIKLLVSIVAGFLIGYERETRGKDAGVSTHILVIAGSMLFTVLSDYVDPASRSRIAAQIVSGIGFLGAGLIFKEGSIVRNLTTAASLWFAAAIGMALGFGFYVIALLSTLISVVIPRIPAFKQKNDSDYR
jgi:putative Mg2+ transporter-C (MgtC) family protein